MLKILFLRHCLMETDHLPRQARHTHTLEEKAQKVRVLQVDAMSDAVDNAEVMLSCISLAYKERRVRCKT